MLEHIEALGLVTEPLGVLGDDGGDGVAVALVEVPVPGVVVPDDGLEAEDAFGDGADTVVDVAEGWAPETRDTAAVEVRDDLHGPAELGDDLVVGEGGHWELAIAGRKEQMWQI